MKKKPSLGPSQLALWLAALVLASIGVMWEMQSGEHGSTRIDRIVETGLLRVLTRNTSTTYYESNDEPAGPEHDLVRAFAEHLGVRVELVVKESIPELLQGLLDGEGDMVAGGVTRTEAREAHYRFGPDYHGVQQQVVCGDTSPMPKTQQDLVGRSVTVIAGSSYAETLDAWRLELPELVWNNSVENSTEQILEQVAKGEIDCTLADSNIVAVNRRYHPKLHVAFAATEVQQLAWVLPEDAGSLGKRIDHWMEKARESGTLASVMERYYGHVDVYDHYDLRIYRDRIASRLPKYKAMFETAAAAHGMPWTLLAAQAYQESHWDALAKSATGVRGLMMLTRNTAGSVGVKDRLNARQSIIGGALYLKRMIERLPETVVGDDRLSLGLAAYNVGMGHLMDARQLAVSLGRNPDTWVDMKEVLPLLSVQAYHQKLRYGYARGSEPVRYVTRIRNYEDLLKKELQM